RVLDLHSVERGGGDALLHALRSAPPRHAISRAMVRRGCGRPLDTGHRHASRLAGGASAFAAAGPPLAGRSPVRRPAAVPDTAAAARQRTEARPPRLKKFPAFTDRPSEYHLGLSNHAFFA